MSYTRSYREVVSGSRTVSVSYPASEHGGSTSVTVDVDIPVNISVNVDTRHFDRSVTHCEHGVSALTGAVAATGAAQVAAVTAGAHKVADTILNGFFKLIRSELTQQIAENRARCEALFLKLNDMKSACLSRKAQMEKDFARIAGRYTMLFQDFDRELAHRVRAIDEVSFAIRDEATAHEKRLLAGGISTIPGLVGGEDSQARTNLGVCSLRGDALGLLRAAGAYLTADRDLNRGVRSILNPGECHAIRDRHVPVLFAEMDSTEGGREIALATGGNKALGAPSVRQNLTECFRRSNLPWVPMDRDTQLRIETFLRNQVSSAEAEPGSRQARVGEMVMCLWQASRPAVLERGNPAVRN